MMVIMSDQMITVAYILAMSLSGELQHYKYHTNQSLFMTDHGPARVHRPLGSRHKKLPITATLALCVMTKKTKKKRKKNDHGPVPGSGE